MYLRIIHSAENVQRYSPLEMAKRGLPELYRGGFMATPGHNSASPLRDADQRHAPGLLIEKIEPLP